MNKSYIKVLGLLLVVGLLFAVAPTMQAQAQTTVSTWDGTYPAERPIGMVAPDAGVQLVNTAKEFAWLASQTNMFVGGVTTVKLNVDIDLANHPWIPSNALGGGATNTFDGNGHTISRLNVSVTSSTVGELYYAAMFVGPRSPAIKNLTIDGANVLASSTVNNRGYAAVLTAGGNWYGLVDNVTIKNSVVGGTKYVAAIVAYGNNSLINCTVQNVTLNVTEKYKTTTTDRDLPHIGGLVGLDQELGTRIYGNTINGLTINFTPVGSLPVATDQIGGLIGTAQAPVLVGLNSVSGVTLNGAPYAKLIGLDNRTYKVVNATQMIGYTTIQAAIDAANAGDTINVAAGSYPEDVLIDRSLTILGPNSDISPVTETRLPEAVVTSFRTQYSEALAGVTIKGFEVTGQVLSTGTLAGIYVGNTQNVTIEHNYIHGVEAHGIAHFDTPISNLNILDNKLINVGTGTNSGVYIGFLTNAVISGNLIDTTPYGGILLTASSTGVDVIGNTISNTAGVGIQVSSGLGDIELSGNIISNAGNGLNEADKGGIRIYGSGLTGLVTVSHNTITGSQNGIGIRDTATCDLTNLLLEHNAIAQDNEVQVYNGCQDTDILDASENWWGSAAGPAAGSLTGAVSYVPWCGEAACTTLVYPPVHNVTQGTYFTTIQGAINATTTVAGDVIEVAAGIYPEAVNVNKAVTIVGTGNIETFTDPITIGATQAPETWYTDRYSPGVFANSTFLGEPVLLHGIRAVDLQPTPFYNTQGRKFDIGLTGPTQLISIDMFVGEDWGTKTRYSGFWATGLDSEDAVSSYPILAWRNNEGDGPGFFAYDYNTEAWLKLRDAVPQDYGKWHTFEIELTVGTGVKYFVDGTSLLTFADADTVSLGNVILNAKNFGEDYDVYWDNFAAHDTKVVGQMSINASNVAINGLILSNPGQTYGMLIDDLVSNVDITENIFVDIGSPTLAQNVKGVYLQYGPDDVLIKDNLFERIHASTSSVNAIFSGDSNSTSPAEQLVIQDNRFQNITSQTKGGYGILLNNGAGNPGAIIDGNRFSGISGGWTHAIGLEGPTADAEVTDNTFYNLTALSPDNLAVLFEDNPGGGSVEVSSNRFQNVGYGVGVNPDDITAYGYTVDATLNYWGSPCGPAAGVADVGPNVTYNPIYTNVELTATGAGVSGSYTFPSGSTTEFMNATIACAAPGSTLTFDGDYPGGIIIPEDRHDLSIVLKDDTVITGPAATDPGYCFNILGDHIRLEAETYAGAKCVPGAGWPGIEINFSPDPWDSPLEDLIIEKLEIDGLGTSGAGIWSAYFISDLQILHNYIHDTGAEAILLEDEPTGVFTVKGNMFKNTMGIADLTSHLVNPNPYDFEYNSWGEYTVTEAETSALGTFLPVDFDPWTHMELFIEHVAGSSPWVNQLVSNNTMEITYAVKADMKEITGAEFLLKIPAGLTVKSATAADVFDTQSAWAVPGGVQYYGAQFDPTAAGSAPVTGQAITLFTVTLTASAPGTYDLTIDETTDAFSMLPPMEPAPSTWVYLDEAHKATLKAITLPTLATTLTANYQVGVVQEFTVTITNPTTGGLFTEPVLVFTGLPAGTTLEYFDGTNWVPFTGAITPDLTFGVTPVVVELQFRVTFTAPAGAYAITITLNDSLTDPDEFLAQTSGTATVTLLTTPLVGTLSMQGRAFRGDIPMTLTPTTLTGFAACTKKSINHISDNITFVGCLVGDTYVITTNQERYLDVTVVLNRTINLLTPDYIITALELKAGDADDSNNIDVSDAGIVGGAYGTGSDVRGDLNFDGKFNIQDLALVGGNYGYDTRTLSTDPLINPYLNWVP